MTHQSPQSGQTRGGTGTAAPPVAIVELWTFDIEVEPQLSGADLAGFSVEATDGHIGKIDEATREAGGSYLIVDTGPWIFGKKVMLPAGVVERIDPEEKKVFVNRSKDEIKSAPEFDEKTGREDKDFRKRLGLHYGEGRDKGRR